MKEGISVSKLLISIMTLFLFLPTFVNSKDCKQKINDYKVVKGSVFPFNVDREKACFFAFYTKNPAPSIDLHGNGNAGDSLWYGYFLKKEPTKIYEFPKPSNIFWSSVCSIEAVSFIDINGDSVREVTVIGSCEQNIVNYTFPFVFIWQNNKYILDEDVYFSLMGKIALTVADINHYIKNPGKYYKYLSDRYNPD